MRTTLKDKMGQSYALFWTATVRFALQQTDFLFLMMLAESVATLIS